MVPFSDLHLVQEDGDLPTTMTTGSAPGGSGVSILNVRFQGGSPFQCEATTAPCVVPDVVGAI
jgi:hypothetical protein